MHLTGHVHDVYQFRNLYYMLAKVNTVRNYTLARAKYFVEVLFLWNYQSTNACENTRNDSM